MADKKQKQDWKNLKLDKSLEKNTEILDEVLGVKKSFDIVKRDLNYAGKKFALYFVDGFAKDDILNRIMEYLGRLDRGDLAPQPIKKLLETYVGYLEVETADKLETIVTGVLSGPLALLVDGEQEAVMIDARTYPARNPEEPDTERVVRGSRDGFVETFIFNTALTRRRLRDPSLRMEYHQVGKRSKTDIAIAYLEDVADPELVETLRTSIKKIQADGLPMAEKSLEEYVFRKNWNPYPMVRYTERPDVASVHLLEGHVLIYVDTSPSVMITPTTFFHHVQHAEEYRQKPAVGAVLRWVRFIAMFVSLFLVPLWYLAVVQPELLPKALEFIGPKKPGEIPLFLEMVIAEVGVEILRMASIHTPSPLATALGLIAAILLGEMAVQAGLFTPEVILYVATAAIGTYATPSYELGLANRITRMILLTLTALFQVWGLVLGVIAWFILLATTRSLNVPYLWPLIPFNAKALLDVLVRSPMPIKSKRPQVLSPGDPDRQQG
ncbi:stage V sporulation protein AF [Melghirimyces profundicolus]|uniref:Stage V sporulation protein AF n=1 Tax=Melghirimyces profundicolus TaxID=1242148 RepID=A0A2T6BTF3_9BACL|nr:spore germination protein [Melghirimyces profundicolus]PTX59316.1 stage V sporulation protein AF [Melghirimyces profundicolus]